MVVLMVVLAVALNGGAGGGAGGGACLMSVDALREDALEAMEGEQQVWARWWCCACTHASVRLQRAMPQCLPSRAELGSCSKKAHLGHARMPKSAPGACMQHSVSVMAARAFTLPHECWVGREPAPRACGSEAAPCRPNKREREQGLGGELLKAQPARADLLWRAGPWLVAGRCWPRLGL